jgi:mannose-6-phosphate isomerase-like protein (cupin superfamily)
MVRAVIRSSEVKYWDISLRKAMDIANSETGKRWILGPWNSSSPVEIGHSGLVETDSHYHERIHEIFFAVNGWCEVNVKGESIRLEKGQVIHFEPGNVHKLTGNGSKDFYMVIIKYPSLPKDKVIVE